PIIVDDKAGLPFYDHSGLPAKDCLYLFMRLESDDNLIFDQALSRVQSAGEPSVLIAVNEIADLGQEFWRFEMATAVIGAVLKINPFDQPDVEAAKIGAQQAMAAWQENGRLPEPERLLDSSTLKISGSHHFSSVSSLENALKVFVGAVQPGNYIAIMAYLPEEESLQQILQYLEKSLHEYCRVPITLGFGPRFLHSTGQLHKGDGNNGLFLQLTGGLEEDLELSGNDYSFATLIAAQAQGDYDALLSKDRRVLALHWHSIDVEKAVSNLLETVRNL
ncbi:MAG: hypothetical protein KAG92_00175, partial [Deltaproteobacteria bacterium]|nr:hypothetical protein [Deltaproteobacteria bacterium]